MDVVCRNLMALLKAGALDEYAPIEPMSTFKWQRLGILAERKQVAGDVAKGARAYRYEKGMNAPEGFIAGLLQVPAPEAEAVRSANYFFNRRLAKIHQQERHTIDTSLLSLELLDILVANMQHLLQRGLSLPLLLQLARFLRQKGDKVDFIKIEQWLAALHMRAMAALVGSILVELLAFAPDELPFMPRVVPAARGIALQQLNNLDDIVPQEQTIKQTKGGFVYTNPRTIKQLLKHSTRSFGYAPIECLITFLAGIARSFPEIQE